MSSTTTTSKTIFLLSLWLGLATSRIIELQPPRTTQIIEPSSSSNSSSSSSSSIECVVYLETNEYGSEETMCLRRGIVHSGGAAVLLLDQHHYLELPEMLELLYEDEIEQGSLVVSVANVEIEDDQVLWDEISDFKVLEPSNAIICRVGLTTHDESHSHHQTTECIPIEHGIESTSHAYKLKLPEPLTTQFEQAIQDGILYLSMIGAIIEGDRLIVPEDEASIKVLVLDAEEE